MVRPPSPPSHRHNCRSASSVSTATVPPRHHLQTPPHCLFPSAPDGSRAWGLGLHRGVILSPPPSLQCRHLLAIAISLSSSSLRHRLLFAIAISSPPARRRRLYTAAVLLWRPFIGVPSHRHLFITLPFVTTALLTPPPPSLRPPPIYSLFTLHCRLLTAAAAVSSPPPPSLHCRRLFSPRRPFLPPSFIAVSLSQRSSLHRHPHATLYHLLLCHTVALLSPPDRRLLTAIVFTRCLFIAAISSDFTASVSSLAPFHIPLYIIRLTANLPPSPRPRS